MNYLKTKLQAIIQGMFVNVSFVLSGAISENIVIKRGTTTLDTVALNASGVGTATTISCFIGEILTFTGSVSGYEKTVAVSGVSNQSVGVYPTNTVYWYGNKLRTLTRYAIREYNETGYTAVQPTMTDYTNYFYTAITNNARQGIIAVPETFDFSLFSSVKVISANGTSDNIYNLVELLTIGSLTDLYTVSAETEILSGNTSYTSNKTTTLNVAGVTTNQYLAFKFNRNLGTTLNTSIKAIWLE